MTAEERKKRVIAEQDRQKDREWKAKRIGEEAGEAPEEDRGCEKERDSILINESNRGVFCFVCAVASLLFFCPPPAASATHKRTHNFAVSALPCADASGLCSVVVQLPNSSLNPNPPPLL